IRYCYVIDIPMLSAKYLQKPVVQKKPVIQKTPVRKQENVIIPDETYVNRLIAELKHLNGILGAREYNYCMKKLEEILQDGDFDDSEDIMIAVHEALEKYIYRSDTKVRSADWKLLEEYLIKAGYEPVPVKKGDRISDYVVYFENVIPASDKGIKGTIRVISQKPYIITYIDGNEPQKMKLCGKCTVYQ
ncbi:MAG: hypothetical protein K2F73_06280, partial [Ruminococcus sp.]|nr:hypothetical protein [Ruminococcus sp.]